jgi:hypothetical protein
MTGPFLKSPFEDRTASPCGARFLFERPNGTPRPPTKPASVGFAESCRGPTAKTPHWGDAGLSKCEAGVWGGSRRFIGESLTGWIGSKSPFCRREASGAPLVQHGRRPLSRWRADRLELAARESRAHQQPSLESWGLSRPVVAGDPCGYRSSAAKGRHGSSWLPVERRGLFSRAATSRQRPAPRNVRGGGGQLSRPL